MDHKRFLQTGLCIPAQAAGDPAKLHSSLWEGFLSFQKKMSRHRSRSGSQRLWQDSPIASPSKWEVYVDVSTSKPLRERAAQTRHGIGNSAEKICLLLPARAPLRDARPARDQHQQAEDDEQRRDQHEPGHTPAFVDRTKDWCYAVSARLKELDYLLKTKAVLLNTLQRESCIMLSRLTSHLNAHVWRVAPD